MGIKTLGNPPVTNGILYVNNYAALPVVGDIKLLYVTKDNNKAFRYSGTAYVGVFINKSDTAVNWTASNPILAQGEIGIELVTNKLKIGNGVLAWNDIAYFGGSTIDTIQTVTQAEAISGITFSSRFISISGAISTDLTLGAFVNMPIGLIHIDWQYPTVADKLITFPNGLTYAAEKQQAALVNKGADYYQLGIL